LAPPRLTDFKDDVTGCLLAHPGWRKYRERWAARPGPPDFSGLFRQQKARPMSDTYLGATPVPAMADELASHERQKLRARSFRETPYRFAERMVMGTHFALLPGRVQHLPRLLSAVGADLLRGGTQVPDPERVVACPDLFGGVCRSYDATSIIEAAKVGFSAWCHIGPQKWLTFPERMVLFFDENHIAKRLRRDMKSKGYRVTFDTAFEDVIVACAGRRSYRRHALTWITPQVMRVYADLFDRGVAHSFEVWNKDGILAGGGFGLSIGRIFITDSQFSWESNTSKIGFASLNHHLAKWGYVLNDGKCHTPTIAAMGFRLIPRQEHLRLLREHAHDGGRLGRFTVEDDVRAIADLPEMAPRKTELSSSSASD
jgi:leucyl/phenylalanyl-tRNA--protein transferase